MDGSTATSTSTGISHSENKLECPTCLASFDTKETKRAHMKEDWHVYNLKRKIASLPPISKVTFQNQVLPSRAQNDEVEEPARFEKSCFPCEQHFTSQHAWKAHLKSQTHTEQSAGLISKAPSSSHDASAMSIEDESDEDDVSSHFSPLRCLFCNVESTNMDANLDHMALIHSFFIPDVDYLIDTESLLSYLFTLVSIFHECLFCGTEKSNKYAAQGHMRDKGHCKIDFESDEHQLWQFYDFGGEGEGQDQAAQTVLVPDDDELRLPSGKTLGHRARARLFRQRHSSRTIASHQGLLTNAESKAEDGEEDIIMTPSDRSITMRVGTSSSLIGVSQLQQRALMAVEHRLMNRGTRIKNEYQHAVEKGGNKQKRFKVQSIGKKAGGLEKRLG